MPKLDNGGFGTAFGFQIDKKNETVGFEDSTHTYFDLKDGSKYISVTTLIKKYQPEFSADFWASYKALEALSEESLWIQVKSRLLQTKKFNDAYIKACNVDFSEFLDKKSEILESYRKAGEEACEKGTAKHLQKELSFYDENTRDVLRYGIGGKFSCTKGKFVMDDSCGIYPELLISYDFEDLKICGQADLVCKDGNDIYIIDWKTSKKIEKTSFFDRNTKKHEMLKFPLDNIMSSNFWTYSLQLSTYMYMLQCKHPEFKCKKLMIVHIDDNDNETIYECEYLKDDVERMIKHYKRDSLIRSILDLDKPIIF